MKQNASVLLLCLLLSSCGGVGEPDPGAPPAGRTRVALLVLENMPFEKVIGNPAAPFLNQLAEQNALATQYYANTHPSIGNYFVLTTGKVITNDTFFNGVVNDDNLVRHLNRAGRSWKAYLESLPSQGYTGPDVFPYARHHNPFAYFSDVLNSEAEKAKLVPFSQLAADLGSGQLPDFLYLLPNNQSNMHDCPPGMGACTVDQKIAYGDQWVRDNVGPLLNHPAFRDSGLLILTFDESAFEDLRHNGGLIVTIVAGTKAKPGYRTATFFQHQSALRLMCEQLQLGGCPAPAVNAPSLAEMLR